MGGIFFYKLALEFFNGAVRATLCSVVG